MTAPLLQVRDWQKCFETNRTRGRDAQTHCFVPNKQSGEGYTDLLNMENGEALYGAFHAMILYLSKQPAAQRDGWLTKDGTKNTSPLTATALAKEIKFSIETTKAMLKVTVEDIGWLENHSAGEKQEGAPYPDKKVDLQFIIMAQDYHEVMLTHHPDCISLKTDRIKTDLKGARLLSYFHNDEKLLWPIDKIQTLLNWIPTNNFWCTQVRSLIGIDNVSKNNGALKFENAFVHMKAEYNQTLMTGEQVEEDMHRNNLTDKHYEKVKNPSTGESMWRRKI